MATGPRVVGGQQPLIVIAGPTASGKTRAAIAIAKQYRGEIICADSRTAYKDMDIGTAKPTQEEQRAVPHWGINLVQPGERFTVYDFQQYALKKIAEIRKRGNTPILTGGSGLYIDAVVFSYQFSSRQTNSAGAKNHFSRLLDNTIIVAIATNKEKNREVIQNRAEHMLTNGLEQEATMLGKKYGWNVPEMRGNAYQCVHDHLLRSGSRTELIANVVACDMKLRKKQLTWFRRNPHITWTTLEEIESTIASRMKRNRATIEHESYPGDIQ